MKVLRLSVLTSLFLFIFIFLNLKVGAVEPQLWQDGFAFSEISHNNFLNGHKCETENIIFSQLPPKIGPQIWKHHQEEWCGYYSDWGFVSGTRVAEQGDMKKGLFIRHTGYQPLFFPSDTSLVRSSLLSGYYYLVGIDSGVLLKGKNINYTTNNIDYYKGREVTGDSSKILRFGDGVPMRMTSFGVSENGEWAVFVVSGKGLVRVSTDTREMTTFSTYERASTTSSTTHNLSITNDGRYVVFTDANMRKNNRNIGYGAMLFDLSGCTTLKPNSELLSTDSFKVDGCQEFDLFTEVKSRYPTAYAVSEPWIHPLYPRVELRIAHREMGTNTAQTIQLTASYAKESLEGYLAMGDSFSSGEGDLQGGDWYEPGTDEQGDKDTFAGRNLCHLSRRSYPYLLAKELGFIQGSKSLPVTPEQDGLFHSVACSGTKIHNVIGRYGEDQGPGTDDDFAKRDNQYRYSDLFNLWQTGVVAQIKSLNKEKFAEEEQRTFSPEVITLGIGGNDARFGDFIKACALPATCRYAIEQSQGALEVAVNIANLKDELAKTYKEIRQTSPDSRVYVHGYPNFVRADGPCKSNVPFDAQELQFISEGVAYMNEVVKAAADEAGVFYVDVESILDNRQLCSLATENDIAFNGITAGNDFSITIDKYLTLGFCKARTGCFGNESFHPNPSAHVLYAQAIDEQTNSFSELMPPAKETPIPLPSDFFGPSAVSYVVQKNQKQIPSTDAPIPELVELIRPGETEKSFQIIQSNLLPESEVTLTLYSDPIKIGSYIVDSEGIVEISAILPENAPSGHHELHLTGIDAFGNNIDLYEPIFIAYSAEDFDEDGILNESDSCPTVVNSSIDIDQDEVDDACDSEYLNLENNEEAPVEIIDVDKGTPNPETVAGNEERSVEQPEVLGTSTSESDTLAQTGTNIFAPLTIGFMLVLLPIVMLGKRKKYSVR